MILRLILVDDLGPALQNEAANREQIKRNKVQEVQLSTLSARWEARKLEPEENILPVKPRHCEAQAKLEDDWEARGVAEASLQAEQQQVNELR